jgi:hypothetical protein
LQAGGRRFDSDWLHHPLPRERHIQSYGLATAPSLLFKNPREVLFLTLSFQAKDIVFNSLENVAFAM